MTIRVELADDPDLSGWTELTEVDRRTLRCGGIANKTEVGTAGGFDWYDDAGVRSIPGRRPLRVIETDTTPDTTLFYGRVSTKGVGRKVVKTADAKNFGVSLDDRNADLSGIIVDGWVRPAETDVARVNALITTFLSGAGSTSPRARTSTDLTNTYVVSSPTVSLPAETYTDSSPARVLQDICSATGKECFVTVDGELFYAAGTSTVYASDYSITDDNPDMVDELPPIWEGDAATEDPTELLSGARAKYGNSGTAFVTDSRGAVEAAFDKWEDTVFLQTTSAAKAALQLDALLDNQGIEEKSRRCSVEVPRDQVDRIKWGQMISFRAAASGDLTPVTLRISYLLWQVPISPTAPYIAHLELSKPKKIAARIKKGTNPAVIPGAVQPTPYIVGNCPANTLSIGLEAAAAVDVAAASKTFTLLNAPITDFLVAVVRTNTGGVSVACSGWTPHPNNGLAAGTPQVHMFHKRAAGVDESATFTFSPSSKYDIDIYSVTEAEYAEAAFGNGTGTAIAFGPITGAYGEHMALLGPIVTNTPGISITPNATTDGISEGNSIDGNYTFGYGQLIHTWPTEWQATHQIAGTASGSSVWAALTLAFSAGSCVPMDGAPVENEEIGTGDGVTTTFFTAVPYEPGSLSVYVDGIEVSLDIASTDPPNRSVTLSFAPSAAGIGAPAETVSVDYITRL